jgi:predicted secreted protein
MIPIPPPLNRTVITATYSGDNNNLGSSGSVELTVKPGKFPTYVYPTANMTYSISATVGETFIIQLTASPSTGYDWNVSTSKGIQFINYTVVSSPPHGVVGGSYTRDYFFTLMATGPQTIVLRYQRSWSPSVSPTIITVNVNPSSVTAGPNI